MTGSSVLYQNDDSTVWLLDLPRSIEEGQVSPGDVQSKIKRQLVSAPALTEPFKTPEPKNGVANGSSHLAAQVSDLMTSVAVRNALDDLGHRHRGPWFLPRQLPRVTDVSSPEPAAGQKRKNRDEDNTTEALFIPEGAEFVLGDIKSSTGELVSRAPLFDLIVIDPPWPNRSVRTKKQNSYRTAYDTKSVGELLCEIPIGRKLSSRGIVAVWVTNKPALWELLTSRKGVLAEWGLDLVGTWTWVKVTASGEPVVDLDSQWRKPWERLLIARRKGSLEPWSHRDRVIITVPDVHSRKPCLRHVFDDLLPPGYKALEVFARNLTAGWWSWGDEVLLFQHSKHWVEIGEDDEQLETV